MASKWRDLKVFVLSVVLVAPEALALQADPPKANPPQPQRPAQDGAKPDPSGTLDVKPTTGKAPTTAAEALEIAKKQFTGHNFPAAISALEYVLANLDPVNVPARTLLGRLYAAQRRFPEAIAQFDSIIGDHPDDLSAKCQLAMVYNQGGQAQKALDLVEPILAKEPAHVEALLAKAQSMLAKNQPDGEQLLHRVIDLDPDNYIAYYLIGRACHVTRRHREAIFNYRKCMSVMMQKGLDPIFAVPTLEFLARIYLDLGEYEKSIQMADQVMPVTPRKAEVHFMLGMAHGMMQHYDKAQEHLSKVVELRPNDFEARLRYAYILSTQNKLEEALAQYEAAKSINPTHPFAYSQIGVLNEQLGRKEEARFAYQKSVDLDPKVAAPFYLYAKFLKEEGNGAQAVKYLENALRVDPLDVQSYYVLGQILQASSDAAEKKRGEDSMKTFEKLSPYKTEIELSRSALEVSPQKLSGRLFLAARFQDIGRNEEALQALNAAAAIDPGDAQVLKQRGLLHLSMGKKDEARQDLEKAQQQLPDDADVKTALESLK